MFALETGSSSVNCPLFVSEISSGQFLSQKVCVKSKKVLQFLKRDDKIQNAIWPIGQVVKTAASHAVNIGSNPVWVTILLLEDNRIVGVD